MARPGRPALPKPDLHPSVDAFLNMLQTERNAALNTRQAYWRDLADVSLFLKNKADSDINVANTDEIKAYHNFTPPISDASILPFHDL